MNTKSKIVKLPALKIKIARLRKQGYKIAFTNGCFDVLHYGHVSYLEQAKKTERVLIVGLNSDRSVRKIKGPKRPIINENGRAAVLAGLACVDYVTLFNEDTPANLIEEVKPDILIKGADWKGKGAVGSDLVLANGGKIEFIKFIEGFSSTDIIKRIKGSGRKKR
jgi:D-beta-D-heptose 7-phosphate kinase/D-beta-D-heptose 1-phosphate adenosyltransferase